MFCPFVNGDCVTNCVFNDEPNDCKILTNLGNIEYNTSCDQTDSSYIDSKLRDVLSKLDDILKKL